MSGVMAAEVAGVLVEDLFAEAFVVAAAVQRSGEKQLAERFSPGLFAGGAVGNAQLAGLLDIGMGVTDHVGLLQHVVNRFRGRGVGDRFQCRAHGSCGVLAEPAEIHLERMLALRVAVRLPNPGSGASGGFLGHLGPKIIENDDFRTESDIAGGPRRSWLQRNSPRGCPALQVREETVLEALREVDKETQTIIYEAACTAAAIDHNIHKAEIKLLKRMADACGETYDEHKLTNLAEQGVV